MFTIIGTMFTGIILGYILRNMDFLRKTEKTISYTIVLLLFIMGLSVGSNDRITLIPQHFDLTLFISS